MAWFAIALVGALCLALQRQGIGTFQDTGYLLLALAAIVTVTVVLVVRTSFRDDRWVAQEIEQRFPELSQRLVTAMDLRPSSDGKFGFLQRQVIDQTLQHASLQPWEEKTVPQNQISKARLLNIPAFIFLAVVITGLVTSKAPTPVVGNSVSPPSVDLGPTQTTITVKPGNAEIERGTNLLVVARFDGPVPAEAQLVAAEVATEGIANDGGPVQQTTPMTRSLDDPVFGGSLVEVNQPLEYFVAYAGRQSETYRITVFEYPTLLRADAHITFPSYTGLQSKLVEDTRRISAVVGSTIEWRCHLNKRVTSAVLIDGKGRSTHLEPSDSASTMYAAAVQLDETRRWAVQLIDDVGRTNKYEFELVAKVLPNKPPEIKLEMARDVSVSPLEELPVAANVRDDFGLRRFGLAYSFGGNAPTEIVLANEVPGKQAQSVQHIVDFEALDAEPDQLLSYHFWAEDHGVDGEIRRTFSDMYFAEVRPFEEIFREGESPPGGQPQQQQQGENAEKAQQLGELQKEIINATWKVIRREISGEPTAAFAPDVTLLRESQSTALEQLDELAGELNDPESLEFADAVRNHMDAAIEQLSKAIEGSTIDPISPALSAEQASYQALLKLRAREHEVVRSQQQQQQSSSSSASSRSRQQMEELELDDEQNRYETERQAQSEEQQANEEQQREVRQILNRLRELARRQEDLNEQLKELQSALAAAETEAAREEIRRQLQRLREQEQQLLRDTDELADRMDQAQDQEQTQEARDQLDKTRENVRQASEALSEEKPAEALTAGTRAEREFKRMRDDFRREAATQFSEEMREMRDDVQAIDKQQQELSEQIADLPNNKSGRLRSDNNRDQIRDDLKQQRDDLGKLLERMQETVQEAEESEPLLAENLYDSFRETKQRQIDEKLTATEELLRRGFDPQAQELEEGVRQGINDLRKNIESAASDVLGDETEGLRRALGELNELVRQLDNEVNEAQGNQTQNPGQQSQGESPSGEPTEPQQSGEQNGEQQTGRPGQPNEQPRDNESQNGEPSEQQTGEPQNGEQQPGQGQPGQQQSEQAQNRSEQSQQPGQQPSEGQQSGQQPGQQNQGQQNQGQQQPGQRSPGQQQQQQPGQQPGQNPRRPNPSNQTQQRDGGRGGLAPFNNDSLGGAPLTGDEFREWSDRLRDVEEMVSDPQLRSEAAQVRDRAREIRLDYKRHSKEPRWNEVRELVADPLRELRLRVSQELMRRSAERTSLVPIDRDAVPEEFTEQVQSYYERLGSGD